MFILVEGSGCDSAYIGQIKINGDEKDYLNTLFSSNSELYWTMAGLWWDAPLARRIASKTETVSIYYQPQAGYTEIWIM